MERHILSDKRTKHTETKEQETTTYSSPNLTPPLWPVTTQKMYRKCSNELQPIRDLDKTAPKVNKQQVRGESPNYGG